MRKISIVPLWMHVYSCICIILSFQSLSAQSYIYQNFTVEDGLSSSIVFDIYQDIDGKMWFATQNGISSYDGFEFDNFSQNDTLNNSIILDFFPQKDGTLWFWLMNKRKIVFYEPVEKRFTEYPFNDILHEALGESNVIESIYVEDNKTLRIGATHINSEIIIDAQGTLVKTYDQNEHFQPFTVAEKIHDNRCHFFFVSDTTNVKRNQSFVSGLSNELKAIRFQESTIFIQFDSVRYTERIASEINQRKMDVIGLNNLNDHYTVNTRKNGAYLFNQNHMIIDSFLQGYSVTNVFIDHFGGYWFSTLHSGVFQIQNPSIKLLDIPNSESVKDVVGGDSSMYILTKNGSVYNYHQDKLIATGEELGLDGQIVYHTESKQKCTFHSSGKIYIGQSEPFYTSFVSYLSNEFMDGQIISAMNNFINLNEKRQVYSLPQRIKAVSIFRDTMYIGLNNGMYIQSHDSVSKLSDHFFTFDHSITDMSRLENDLFCYSTIQSGIWIDHHGKKWNIKKEDGLFSNHINTIFLEDKNTIWVGSNHGVNRIQFQEDGTYQIIGISKADGLSSNQIKNIFCKDSLVWINTNHGLHFLAQDQLNLFDNRQSYLRLSGIELGDQWISEEEGISIPSKSDIRFHISEIYFGKNPLLFRYRLKEQHHSWQYTTDRYIDYSNLSPGYYTLEIQSCVRKDHCNSEVLAFPFKVPTVFYKRSWFIGIIGALIILLAYLFFRWNVLKYNQDVARELMRIALKKLKRKENMITFKENGREIKIKSDDILYISASGNYLDIFTRAQKITVRHKIGEFIDSMPDPMEYVRIHRSYIVRIDQISTKAKSFVKISDIKLPVSRSYQKELSKIQF